MCQILGQRVCLGNFGVIRDHTHFHLGTIRPALNSTFECIELLKLRSERVAADDNARHLTGAERKNAESEALRLNEAIVDHLMQCRIARKSLFR
jgi:hypothetical protein